MFDVSVDYEICSYISICEIKAHIVEHQYTFTSHS